MAELSRTELSTNRTNKDEPLPTDDVQRGNGENDLPRFVVNLESRRTFRRGGEKRSRSDAIKRLL